MNRGILLALSLGVLVPACFGDTPRSAPGGSVCFGPINMFAPYTAAEHVELVVDDLPAIKIESTYHTPQVLIDGLTLGKVHRVQLRHEAEVLRTWQVDFRRFKAPMVRIWRSPGYWHLEPALRGVCSTRRAK